jgi:hypothetical protein
MAMTTSPGGGGGAGEECSTNNVEALMQRVLRQRKVKERAAARELVSLAQHSSCGCLSQEQTHRIIF